MQHIGFGSKRVPYRSHSNINVEVVSTTGLETVIYSDMVTDGEDNNR